MSQRNADVDDWFDRYDNPLKDPADIFDGEGETSRSLKVLVRSWIALRDAG